FFFSSRRRHTRSDRDWSSDVCSSDLAHLAQCAECRTIAERERKLIRELSQLTRFAPEFGFVERVMAKVKIPTPSGPHLRPHTDEIGRASCRERVELWVRDGA